jgi:uncharacterized protein GlcG (DUF336 family)
MKNHTVMWRVLSLVVALFAAMSLTFAPVLAPNFNVAPVFADDDDDDDGNKRRGCGGLPSYAELTDALKASVFVDGVGGSNGGFDLNMWATVVNRDGVVCAVTRTGEDRGDQWPGSRVISAQKANTANAFSLPGLALSTANLWAATQPGGSLFGLQFSNPVDTAVAYGGSSHAGGNAKKYGTRRDPLVGDFIGGVNVFGGGLALYTEGKLVGALGVSGDSSCADHNIAWRVRDQLGLDFVPAGVGAPGDNIIFDLLGGSGRNPESAGGFGHPTCGVGSDDATDNATIVAACPLGDGPTTGCV